MTKSKSELDLAFQQMEEDFAFTREARRELISKLRAEANKLTFGPDDKAMVLTAKVSILKTLDDVLKSDSDLALQKLKAKLARKDSEANGEVGKTIVAMLKNIKVSDFDDPDAPKAGSDPTDGAMDAIQDRVKELVDSGDSKLKKSMDISEGELQECSGKPSTERPVTKLKPLKQTDDEE